MAARGANCGAAKHIDWGLCILNDTRTADCGPWSKNLTHGPVRDRASLPYYLLLSRRGGVASSSSASLSQVPVEYVSYLYYNPYQGKVSEHFFFFVFVFLNNFSRAEFGQNPFKVDLGGNRAHVPPITPIVMSSTGPWSQ